LPKPEWKFPNAKIEMFATESQPDFPPNKQAPKGSPNILLVLLDDVGFGWMSVTGGLVRSPTAEKLFKRGLLYNQFHTTALCSPTRAALLTGRNHHSVATGVIQEMATGYPGYCGIHSERLRDIRRASQTIGLCMRMVRQEPQCAG
jgi:arylsulfatase